MSKRTEYVTALCLLVAGGVLGLVAASQVWGSATIQGSLSSVPEEVTGNDLVPLASAVSLVSLASVLAVPAVRNVGRRIVGALLVLLGGGVVIAAWTIALSLNEHVSDWVTAGAEPRDSGQFAGTITTTPLWAVALVIAGLLVWASGILVATRGPRWPHMGARYERQSRGSGRPHRDAWDALDQGEDPSQSP